MTARVRHLRIEERALSLTGEVGASRLEVSVCPDKED